MTNTLALIEIITVKATDVISGTIVVIYEQPVNGGGINETQEENSIYGANVVYEF